MEDFSYSKHFKELYEKHRPDIVEIAEIIAKANSHGNPKFEEVLTRALEEFAKVIITASVDASIIIRNRENRHYLDQDSQSSSHS